LIVTDFEIALISAIKSVYTNTTHKGCYFHFCQSIWRRLQQEGLSIEYNNDKYFNYCIRSLFGLAFVPLAKFKEYYQVVLEKIKNNGFSESKQRFLKYFNETYVEKDNCNESMFSINFWNCHDSMIKCQPITTNSVEAWHRTINTRISIPHVNLGKLIAEFMHEETLNRMFVTRFLSGNERIVFLDSERKYELLLVVKNCILYTKEGFFKNLQRLYCWKFILN
jgi:hypothetical protein